MTTMKKSIHDNANGLDYTLVNDHYLPNLTAAASAEYPSSTLSGITNCSCPVS